MAVNIHRTARVVGVALVLAVAMSGSVLAGPEATTNVSIVGSPRRFTPKQVRIRFGDAVLWTNNDSTHTTTGYRGTPPGPGLWNSGHLENSQTFSFQFNVAGSFGYRCSLHHDMTGVVSVLMRAAPPQGGVDTIFTITWGVTAVPAGDNVDVQVSRPGGPGFVDWTTDRTVLKASFTPDAGTGTYQFRARLQSGTQESTASAYSEAASITVT
jgi:plastocyanin